MWYLIWFFGTLFACCLSIVTALFLEKIEQIEISNKKHSDQS